MNSRLLHILPGGKTAIHRCSRTRYYLYHGEWLTSFELTQRHSRYPLSHHPVTPDNLHSLLFGPSGDTGANKVPNGTDECATQT